MNQNIFASLERYIGDYEGHGVNHEGETFTGTFKLKPSTAGTGFTIQFKAMGKDGMLFHQEESIIARAMDEKLYLWNLNSNTPGLVPLDLRRQAPEGGAEETFVFGFNDTHNLGVFREEVAIDLWADGSVSYRYSWALPGGEFKERSSVKLARLEATRPRPEFIKHYGEIQSPDTATYPGSQELLSIGSAFARKMGLKKFGIHHELLPPGRRTSWPHAESLEEEFVYVIEGYPDAWIDGNLYRLVPGDAVAFLPGTGISHCFINNTHDSVRLIVAGEVNQAENKCIYPVHPARNAEIRSGNFLWEDVPPRELGPHDGLPDAQR